MLDKIKVRIETLKKECDSFITEANQRLRAYNVAIAELEALIAPEAEALIAPEAEALIAPEAEETEDNDQQQSRRD